MGTAGTTRGTRSVSRRFVSGRRTRRARIVGWVGLIAAITFLSAFGSPSLSVESAGGPVRPIAVSIHSGSAVPPPASPSLAAPSAGNVNDSAPTWVAGPAKVPPPRIDPAFASDPNTGLGIEFGGYQNTSPPCTFLATCASGQTWTLSGASWTNETPITVTANNSPSDRFGAAMAYDDVAAEFVLFGGAQAEPSGLNNPALGDTWAFHPSNDTWTELCGPCVAGTDAPPARWDAGIAYDPTLQQVILFGGYTTATRNLVELSDTWAFNGTNWTQLPGAPAPVPAARGSPSMAWDAQTHSVLLFGGAPATNLTARTWSFQDGNWTGLAPAHAPPPRAGAPAVADPVNGSVIVVGGCTTDPCTTGSLNETWSFSGGDWYRLAPTGRSFPAARDHAALFEIGPTRALAMFGGDAKGRPANDTWFLYRIEVGPAVASPSVVDVGQPVTLTVNAIGGSGGLGYRWLGLPPGCATVNASRLVCTAVGPGPYVPSIRAVVRDGIGNLVDSAATTVRFNALPNVTVTASPLSGVVPLQTSFYAAATGGTGTLAYQWNFGDAGVGTGPNPSHTYLRAGNFTATVWANDSLGRSSQATISVRVLSLLGIDLVVSPVRFEAGNTSEIAITGFGGIPPYTYAFSGLPSGCVTTTANTTRCTISTPGTYPFTATVSDHSGQTNHTSGQLDVLVRNSSSTPPAGISDWDLLFAGIAGGVVLGLIGIYLYSRRRRPPPAPPSTIVPLPGPDEFPRPGGSLYVPPPEKAGRRRP